MSHTHMMILAPVLKTHSIKQRDHVHERIYPHRLASIPKQNHLAQGLLGVNHRLEGFA